MKKPERKKIVKFNPNEYGHESERLENEMKEIYNQGLSDMEAYYKGSELSENEIYEIINKTTLENKGCVIKEVAAQAIISARAKKRGE